MICLQPSLRACSCNFAFCTRTHITYPSLPAHPRLPLSPPVYIPFPLQANTQPPSSPSQGLRVTIRLAHRSNNNDTHTLTHQINQRYNAKFPGAPGFPSPNNTTLATSCSGTPKAYANAASAAATAPAAANTAREKGRGRKARAMFAWG